MYAAALFLAFAGDAGPVEVGKPAPPVDLPGVNLPRDSKGGRFSLDDVKGKNAVLFFFPKAMTRG